MTSTLWDSRGTVPPVALARLPALAGQISVCSGCSSVKVGDWYLSGARPEELVKTYGDNRLTHGYQSQACQDGALKQLHPRDYKALPPACSPRTLPTPRQNRTPATV